MRSDVEGVWVLIMGKIKRHRTQKDCPVLDFDGAIFDTSAISYISNCYFSDEANNETLPYCYIVMAGLECEIIFQTESQHRELYEAVRACKRGEFLP